MAHAWDGATMAAVRAERGLTQVELAERANLTQSLVSDYERGQRKPSVDTLVRIARALEVSADRLLGIDT